MGSYTQFRTAVDSGDLRRATWICGDQHTLIEEAITAIRTRLNPSPLDSITIHATTGNEPDVWAHANQHPLNPGAVRMILIRDADNLTGWDRLHQWLSRTRQLPGVYLVFVSSEPDLPYVKGSRKTLQPHVAALRAPRGYLVRCTMPNENDTLTWLRRHGDLDDTTARYLLNRTGGNLDAAAATADKLALFDLPAGTASIDALTPEIPAGDLADNLIALDRRRALLQTATLSTTDVYQLLGLLESRLDLLETLHRQQVRGTANWRESDPVNAFLARRYQPHARHYDPKACTRRRLVLAATDAALRTGATIGVVETLIALW